MEGRKEPMQLIGPAGLKQMVDIVMERSGGWYPEDAFPLQFIEIPSTTEVQGNEGSSQELSGSDGFGPRNMGFNPERCAKAAPVHLGTFSGLTVLAAPMVHTVPDW
eukprot:4873357-Amphidinium_carterae.1